MVFAAQKLRLQPALKNPAVLIVVDRVDLDAQISATFHASDIPNLVMGFLDPAHPEALPMLFVYAGGALAVSFFCSLRKAGFPLQGSSGLGAKHIGTAGKERIGACLWIGDFGSAFSDGGRR